MPADPSRPRIAFHNRPVETELIARSRPGLSASQVAARDLARHYALLSDALDLAYSLSDAAAIARACRGHTFTPATIPYLWAIVEQELRDEMDADTLAVLVQSLKDLTPAETHALVDAVERALILESQGTALADALRAVGLVKEDR